MARGGVDALGTEEEVMARGEGTGRRGDSRDDGLFHNSLIRTLKRHLQDSLVCGNMLMSLLSFGNFWPGQEDQREANEMAGYKVGFWICEHIDEFSYWVSNWNIF